MPHTSSYILTYRPLPCSNGQGFVFMCLTLRLCHHVFFYVFPEVVQPSFIGPLRVLFSYTCDDDGGGGGGDDDEDDGGDDGDGGDDDDDDGDNDDDNDDNDNDDDDAIIRRHLQITVGIAVIIVATTYRN